MARTKAQIQAEIDTLESLLSDSGFARKASFGQDGAQVSYRNRKEISDRLDQLYADLDRAENGIFSRTRLDGAGDHLETGS